MKLFFMIIVPRPRGDVKNYFAISAEKFSSTFFKKFMLAYGKLRLCLGG